MLKVCDTSRMTQRSSFVWPSFPKLPPPIAETRLHSVSGVEVEVNTLGYVELRLREGDRLIPARVVSEGTLRILGLSAGRPGCVMS